MVDFQQKVFVHEIHGEQWHCQKQEGLKVGLLVEHWVETQLAPSGKTVLLMPQSILEAVFYFSFNKMELCMKSVLSSGIGTKRVGGSRFGSGAHGGDPTGAARENSTASATTNL